jgi:hypothetical protein
LRYESKEKKGNKQVQNLIDVGEALKYTRGGE